MTFLARAIAHSLLDQVQAGRLIVREAGRPDAVFGPRDPRTGLHVVVDVHDARAWRALLLGSATFGGSYADEWWDTDDLVSLVRIIARDATRLDRRRARALAPLSALQTVAAHVRANAVERSRHQIAAHYDLDDGLFDEMLDETMTYSCALFADPAADLAAAQVAKLDRVCCRLELKPDDHLLEIGTGWGSLAIHAARKYGCRVTTTTISAAQLAVARRRIREAGLDGLVTVRCDDYRHLTGRFDKLVCIEMIEAVGTRYLPAFFRCLGDRLAPDGLALLQCTTIDPIAYDVARGMRTFIQVIFPGGVIPSLETIVGNAWRAADLRVVAIDDITAHYVPTLRAWRERFQEAAPQLAARGYDERFRRLWTFYLSYCEAGFAERRIQNLQILLAGPELRREPMRVAASAQDGAPDVAVATRR